MMTVSDGHRAATFRQTPIGLVVEAIERLAGATNIEEVVETIRATARKAVGSDGIAVILRDDDHVRYVEEDAVGPLWKGGRFPIETCISGMAILERRTIAIPDIRADERVPQPLYRDTFVRSMVMAPVRAADPVGAIGAYWGSTYEPAPHEIEALETLARAAATAIENARLMSALSRALAHAELARDELRHRVKNAFAASQALAGLTLPSDQAQAMGRRLTALALAHDLIDRRLEEQPVIALQELLDAELEPYAAGAPGRFEVHGPTLILQSAEAVALGLAVNELATNALKYGALSVPNGRLRVWWRQADGLLRLYWRESDGPATPAGAVEGFGSKLLDRLVRGQLRGELKREFDAAGVTCRITFRLAERAAQPQAS